MHRTIGHPSTPPSPSVFLCLNIRGRFVFSEVYLKSVGSDLALNILCAVANPLGAEGMLRIVRGALCSRDLRKDLLSLALPFVLIQVSTLTLSTTPEVTGRTITRRRVFVITFYVSYGRPCSNSHVDGVSIY